uniref:Uncharacterized protein n=1 Tax=Gouania willdenowi TaxID=441366 RepID=A0A8C5D4F3_GOUWI
MGRCLFCLYEYLPVSVTRKQLSPHESLSEQLLLKKKKKKTHLISTPACCIIQHTIALIDVCALGPFLLGFSSIPLCVTAQATEALS